MNRTLLLSCALAAACGGNGPAAPERPASHTRMVALLDQLATQSGIDNPFFGQQRLTNLRAELQAAGAKAPWRLRWETAMAELEQGHERDAIDLLAATREALVRGELETDHAGKIGTSFHLAMAYLRLGETENCCKLPNQERCILPIHGQGEHSAREGSQRAVEYFAEVLRNTPPDDYWHYAAAWLLNIAHMTLGSWPDGVPADVRLPASAFAPEGPWTRWPNVAAKAGIDVNGTAGGIVVEDFDGDEWLDVVVSEWAPRGQLRFFHNRGDGTFEDRTERAGLLGITGGLNLVHADHDNDGDIDVLVLRGGWWFEYGQLPCSLLQNRGDGFFDDVALDAGLGERREPTQTAAFVDYDRDGDLDLYIGGSTSTRVKCRSHLYRNDGGKYVDTTEAQLFPAPGCLAVTEPSGVANDRYCKGITVGDVDGDLWPDLFVSNIGGDNRLYRNQANGTFVDIAAQAGVMQPTKSFPTWFWDFDNDGALDLFVANYDTGVAHLASHLLGGKLPFRTAAFYRGDGKGGFRDVARELGFVLPTMPMGCSVGDFDSDGWLDCYLGTGDPAYSSLMPNLLLRNDGGQRLQNVTMAAGVGHLQKGHGVAFADHDHDGDQDLFEVVGGAFPGDAFRNVLFANPGGHGNHWLTVRLVGATSARCGLGARVCVTVRENGKSRRIYRHVGPGASFGGNPLRLELGLGKAEAIERFEVLWPRSGETQVVEGVPMDAIVRVVEGKPGCERIRH